MKLCFIGDIHGKVNTPNDYLLDYNEDLFNQLEWVRCMNNIKNRAEEIVLNELIYC